ncbi:MAG: class I SAM-dependent methyltransferase [Parasphingorhabdus sp.]|uniref:class I SAM-dependent methyltransferase n=1 Tax=Parasphingorhabdus sp. TaxID=2709688 RepID=UPI003299C03A
MQLNIFQQQPHAVLPIGDHDDRVRQEFSKSFRQYIQNELLPGLTPVFEGRASRKFENENGHPPADRHEIRKAMVPDIYFQTYASATRIAQEMLWESVIKPLQKELPELTDKAVALSDQSNSPLETDSDFSVPRYISELDIHCMPGGYATSHAEHDIAAGALYDRGVYLYSMGFMGPDNDDMGQSVCNYIKRNLPEFSPQYILDLGCTIGHSTLPYKKEFPDADVIGIDVAAPCIRYAHARAAAMGHDVGFLQRNAENTGFEDGSFDLIVSHILLHETSGKAMPKIFEEGYRLLKPGGYMIHADLPPFEKMGPFMQFILDNETYYNNEPFWGAMRTMDQIQLAIDAGFDPDSVRFDTAPMAVMELSAEDQAELEDREFVAGEYAPGGGWEVLIARKDP